MPRRGLFSYENALIVILGLTYGIVFFDRQAASNLMPFIKPELGLNNTQVGAIGSALAIGWAVSAFLVGMISDRTGRRKLVLIVCTIGFSLCSVISGLAHTFPVLVASRLFMGLLEGGVMPICLAIMTIESSERRRGLNAGIVQNGFSNLIGNFAGPLVLAAIATAWSWRQAFYLSAIPGLLCAVAVWLWVKETSRPAREPAATTPASLDLMPLLTDLLQMLKVRNVQICALLAIFMVGWLITASVFLPTFLVEYRHMKPAAEAAVMSVTGIAALVGGLTLPALGDWIGRKPVMLLGCLGGLFAPLSALYFDGPVWVLCALQFIGWMSAGVFPIFMGTIPGESLPRGQIATAMGLVVGVGEICGGVFAPLIGGQLADKTSLGLQAPLMLVAAAILVSGALSLLLRETAPAKVAVSAG